MLGLIFKDAQNAPLLGINNKHYKGLVPQKPIRNGSISMIIPYLTLFEGSYFIDVHFGNAFRDIEVLRECFQLIVEPLKFSDAGELPDKQFNKFFIKDVAWNVEERSS
ncbi:MAG: hypothetical protein IPJ20_24555 [Flammeovirgaceae bacterium]|nr:hypothetical protein [Flammeovirgaceae bacterium]